MKLLINGTDFSADIYRYGFAVQYKKLYGKNGGTSIDGTEIVDLIAVKTVISAACNPLTSERLSAFAVVCKNDYVTVQYMDPADGDVRREMIPELSLANKSLTVNGITYWKDVVLSLKER